MKLEWTVQEAAVFLGVSDTTIYNMIERKELALAREVRQGKQRRKFISGASLESARAQRQGTTEETAQPEV